MSGAPVILGVGTLDSVRLVGTGGVCVTWQELGVEAPGDAHTLHRVFDRADSTYRRIDRISRGLILAAEAAGVGTLMTDAERYAAALLAESHVGCLEIDRRYTTSLAGEVIEAAIFPYTLQSTSLGEVALRHGMRGPTIAFSVEPGAEGASIFEAERMLTAGEIRHAVVATVDILDEAAPGLPAGVRVIVAVLGAPGMEGTAVASWPRDGNPFAALAAGLHR